MRVLTVRSRAKFPAALALVSALAAAARAIPAPPVKTVWDQIMEEQSVLNLDRGYALMQEEDYAAAADEFFKAEQRDPSSPWPHLLYGSALYWLGAPDKALDEFQAAIKLDPSNSMAYQLRGIVRARDGKYPEALKDFLRAEKLDPARADVKMNAGSVYQALGDRGKALDYFREAVDADPANPLYRYQLGLFYSRSGRYSEAAEQLRKAISLYPDYEDAMLELAVLRERDGHLKEAVKLYRRALDIKPGDSVARFRLAWALRKQGLRAEALKALDGAFMLAPANEKGGISMALAYAGGNQPLTPARQGSGGPLFSALSKVPPGQEARVTVELLETPKDSLRQLPPGGEMAKRLRSAFNSPQVRYTKRDYFLPPSSPEERSRRVAEISGQADKLLKGVSPDSDARMNFSIDTSVPAKDARNGSNKALYNPRDVGNDMGLWVMGDNWLDNVSEAMDELAGQDGDDRELRLIRGLGHLLLGEPSRALDYFTGGGVDAALGRCAAWVEAGSEDKALKECLEALRLDPRNRTAIADRKWLEGGK